VSWPVLTPPAGVVGRLVGTTDLERWYGLVLAFPDTADRLLNDRRVPDPLMLAALRAQTALQLDKPRTAVRYAHAAVEIAVRENPVNPLRLLAVATVLTDAAVVAGTPDAMATCTDLVALSHQYRDEPRRLVALGLEAVAVFHQQGCQRAARLLGALRVASTEPEPVAAVTLARDSLVACCTRRREPHAPPTGGRRVSRR